MCLLKNSSTILQKLVQSAKYMKDSIHNLLMLFPGIYFVPDAGSALIVLVFNGFLKEFF